MNEDSVIYPDSDKKVVINSNNDEDLNTNPLTYKELVLCLDSDSVTKTK